MRAKWKWLIIIGFALDAVLFTGFIALDWYYDERTIKMAEHTVRTHDTIWDNMVKWQKEFREYHPWKGASD